MPTRIDSVIQDIQNTVNEAAPGFERRYGPLAATLLPHLAAIFQLLRRVPFDLDLPKRARHHAAAAALYIADIEDFLPDTSGEARGLIDDLWVAAVALTSLADDLDDDKILAKHWRAKTPFEEVLGLARNHETIEEHVPKRVLDAVRSFISEA